MHIRLYEERWDTIQELGVSVKSIFDSYRHLNYVMMMFADLSTSNLKFANEILTAEMIMSQLPNDLL
jgi:hypothetical protein